MKKRGIALFFILLIILTGCQKEYKEDSVHNHTKTQTVQLTRYEALYIPSLNLMKEKSTARLKEECTKPVTSLLSYRTFMDSTGYFTTFTKKPKRVAALFSSYAQVWKLAGGTITATVQESITRGIVPEDDVIVVGQGSGKQINIEALLLTKPDLVILTADYAGQIELADVLRRKNIPTLVFRNDSFFDYLTMLSYFTKILGTPNLYEKYGSQVLDRIDTILEATKSADCQENVLLLRAYSYGAKTKGTNHFVGQMLRDLNVHNILDDYKYEMDTLSPEILMTSDITCILITTMGNDEKAVKRYVLNDLFTQPGYASLSAVKNKKYYFLPKELFMFKPNQRWDEAYSYLAKIMYPQIIDATDETEEILP